MLIEEFAKQHNLRMRRAKSGEVILGKQLFRPEECNLVFDPGNGRLGLCVLVGTARRWANLKRKLLAAGFQLQHDGEEEGSFLFDPSDAQQAALAIKVAGLRHQITLSAEVRALRAAAAAKARQARAQDAL